MNDNAVIHEFVQRATEHKCPGEEVEHRDIQATKRLGKRSRNNIRKLFDAILIRLQANNSQIRLCALELWTALFERSSLFRDLACRKLDQFLDNVIAFRPRRALPEPRASAEELKRCGIMLLKRWHQRYAEVLPRLRVAYLYLESSGLMDPPQPAAPSEAADLMGQEAVSRPAAEDSAPVPRELRNAVAEFRSNVSRWKMLVEELKNARNVMQHDGCAQPASFGATHEDVSEGEWEDVEDVEEGGADKLGDSSECLYFLDSYREATGQAMPSLQSIVRTCQRHVGTAEADGVLREATEINSDIVTVCMEYEGRYGTELRSALEGSQRASGSRRRMEHQQDTRVPQKQNPMQMIKDPTTSRAPFKKKRDIERGKAANVSSETSRDKAVLKKLAEVAPVVVASGFARVWDSDAPPIYAGSHAMEVSNHWGPVDVHQELPKDRLDALFLVDHSNIRYKNTGGREEHLPSARPATEPPRSDETHIQGVLNGSLDSRQRRKAERLYNEQMLREANQPNHLSSLEDLPSSAPRGRRPSDKKSKRKLSVQERLAKKLHLKK